MTDSSRQNDNAAFLYGMMACPVLELYRQPNLPPDRRLFFSYQLVETLLWMRLGLRVGYLSRSWLESFLDANSSELTAAFSEITLDETVPKRLDIWEWAPAFERLMVPKGQRTVTINRHQLLQMDSTFESTPTTLVQFQNLMLISSEALLDEPTVNLLSVLNFADDERWMQLSQGMSGDLSLQEVCHSVLCVLGVLNDFAEDIQEPKSDRTVSLNRAAKETLLWKLNFGDPTVYSRFAQVVEIVRRYIGLEDSGRCGGSLGLLNFNRRVDFQLRQWISNTFVSEPDKGLAEEMGKSIEELELSVRGYNELKNNRIETVGDLLRVSEHELLSRGIGQKTLNEVKGLLTKMGLALGSFGNIQFGEQPSEGHKHWKKPDLEEGKS